MACRGRGAVAACSSSARSRSRAATRFCACVRYSRASITSTPSVGDATAAEPQQPGLDRRRQARGGDVDAQLHRGRDLVDVLTARAGGADEPLLEIALVQHNRRPRRRSRGVPPGAGGVRAGRAIGGVLARHRVVRNASASTRPCAPGRRLDPENGGQRRRQIVQGRRGRGTCPARYRAPSGSSGMCAS